MTADAQLAGSGACPECQPAPVLVPVGGPLGAATCAWCGGGLVPAERLPAFRAAVAEAGAASSALTAVTIRCPSCGSPAQRVTLPVGSAAPCSTCRCVWVDAALLAWAEARLRGMAGAFGPEPAPAPPPPLPPRPAGSAAPPRPGPAAAPARRGPLVVAAVVLALLAAGGLSAALVRRSDAEPAVAREVEAARAPAPLAPAAPPPAPPDSRRDDVLHGGRTVAWWGQRLEQLRGATDGERRGLYQATVERAEANGLTVTLTPTGVQVSAGPTPPGHAEEAR